jgi:hypothetical protein
MLESRRREEPHPDLAREWAGCQEMVSGLIVLIAKRADSIRLESMAFPAFSGPQTVVQREPEALQTNVAPGNQVMPKKNALYAEEAE